MERVVAEIPLTEALAIEGPNPPSKGRGSGTETAYYTVLFDEDARAAA